MADFGVAEYIMIAGAVVGAATSIDASNKQKAASRDQKDEQAIQRNKQSADDAIARRADIRQERIRRSQIMQAAANSGASGSSGEANSISNLSASIGANLSGISGGAQTADQMSFMEGRVQDNVDSANQSLAIGKTVSGALNAASTAYDKASDPNKSKSVVTPVNGQPQQSVFSNGSVGSRPIF